jgi:hypothetical protein
MDDLVKELSAGTHVIRADRVRSPEELYEAIEDGFVLLRFPNTGGGTSLGVRLDKSRCELMGSAAGDRNSVHLVGSLVLNYKKVELMADINVATLEGSGCLRLIADETAFRAERAGE